MYLIFFILFFTFFYNIGAFLQPVWQLLHIPNGFYSVPTLGIAGLCSIIIFFQTEDKMQVLSRLYRLLLVWIPWILYLAFRCNYNDPYSVKKLMLMAIAQFGSLAAICLAFYKNQEKFSKYFFVCTMAMTTFLLAYFFVDHGIYSNDMRDRLTTQGINPIMLSRTFSIGAVTLILWARAPYFIKFMICIPFFVGMYLTGSRGPILSLSIILACHYLWLQKRYAFPSIRIIFIGSLVITSGYIVEANFHDSIEHYFTRGSTKGMYEGSGRESALFISWKEFVSAPLTGVGLGMYEKTNKRTYYDELGKRTFRHYPHNIIFEVMAELGIVGALLFMLILKPGGWMFDFSNKFTLLFLLSLIFALTSGDFFDNAGVFIFGCIAWLNNKAQPALVHETAGTDMMDKSTYYPHQLGST